MISRTRRGRAWRAVLTAAALAATVTGCGEPPRPPDVILISVDTLRADTLDRQGRGGTPLTPNLARLAGESVRFTQAVAPTPFTLPSHMSMFTGLYPDAHGVGETRPLATSIPTLPELIRQLGYDTVGFHTNEWIDGKYGFARGFQTYEQIPHAATYADRVVDRALSAVPWRARRRPPVFLFLHFMDPHSDFPNASGSPLPYYSPPEYRQGLGGPDLERHFCTAESVCATEFLLAADATHQPVSAADVALLHDLYDAGVAFLDAQIGRLVAELEAAGVLDRALVILTSDHGEEFREHGLFLHSQVYEETIAVPLLVRLPGGAKGGTTEGGVAGLIDLLPTILSFLGHEEAIPATLTDARDLLASTAAGPRRALLLEDKLRPAIHGLRTDRYKLVYDVDAGAGQLYDLATDPGETRDLAADRPEVFAALVDRLRLTRAALVRSTEGTPPPVQVLSPEQRQRLRALGYVQ